jgi:hypothetical protein
MQRDMFRRRTTCGNCHWYIRRERSPQKGRAQHTKISGHQINLLVRLQRRLACFSVMSSLHKISLQSSISSRRIKFLLWQRSMTSYGNLTLSFLGLCVGCRKISVWATFWRGPRLGLTPSKLQVAESSDSPSRTTVVSRSVFYGRHLTKSSKKLFL